MALKLIDPPEIEPVTLAQAKAHLRVDHDDDDDLIEALIVATREQVESTIQRALITQTWELIIDSFPSGASGWFGWNYGWPYGGEIRLPKPPLQSVDAIYYFDRNGDEQTLSSDDYTVDAISVPGWVLPNSSWPATLNAINSVRIRFTCGYPPGTESPVDLAADVPQSIKAAIKLIVGHLYENRETVVIGESAIEVPQTAEWLLAQHRVYF